MANKFADVAGMMIRKDSVVAIGLIFDSRNIYPPQLAYTFEIVLKEAKPIDVVVSYRTANDKEEAQHKIRAIRNKLINDLEGIYERHGKTTD